MALVAHALQAETKMITHSQKIEHESETGNPAVRHVGYPRVERSAPTFEELEFTNNATAGAINSMKARWHEYNLGLKLNTLLRVGMTSARAILS